MFKISKYVEKQDCFEIAIQFQFLQKETYEVSATFPDQKAAMKFFGEYAIDFLRGQIDEFTKIVEFIKPHYFDKSKVPFMYLGNAWRENYYPFSYSLKPKLSECYYRPGEYAELVLQRRPIFKALIPTLKEIGKLEMETLFQDIMQTAGMIKELMEKLKQIDHSLKKAV